MYLNKKQLTERGWSPKLVTEFLGEPDDKRRLGWYCYEHLYFLPRVERIEKTDDFKTAQGAYLNRRQRGIEAAERRAAEQIEKARTMPIRIREIPYDEVLEDAIDHYNRRGRGRRYDYDEDYQWTPASKDSDELFLQRIAVNYVRHQLTSYDHKLLAQKGKVGGSEAVPIIRRRVFEEIALAYPQLADECDRQMIARGLKSESELKPKGDLSQMELPFA
jgi:hypothetical protein